MVMILRFFVHTFAAIQMAKFAVSDDVDTVAVTQGAYTGMVVITLFEVTYYVFMILAVKLLNNTIGGSQVLYLMLVFLTFASTNLWLLCWWTSSFGKAHRFNKTYIQQY